MSSGYCCLLCPSGVQYSGKIRLIEPQGVNGYRRPVPGVSSAPCSGTPREGQAEFRDGPYGDCIRVLWVPGPRVQYSGKIRFVEKPGVQVYEGRQVAKRSSDPRVAYPEVKLQVRDLVRGYCCLLCPAGVSIRGKFVYRAPGVKWAQETHTTCPEQRYTTGEPGKI